MEDYAEWVYGCFQHRFIIDALCNGAQSLSVATCVVTYQTILERTFEGLVPSGLMIGRAHGLGVIHSLPRLMSSMITCLHS